VQGFEDERPEIFIQALRALVDPIHDNRHRLVVGYVGRTAQTKAALQHISGPTQTIKDAHTSVSAEGFQARWMGAF
jgi:hypothetical protein